MVIENIKDRIKEYRDKTEKGELDYLAWSKLFGDFYQGYATLRYKLNPGSVFRARINRDRGKKVDYFNHINELGAPDEKRVTKIGRCNSVNESVFYCSFDTDTTLFETSPKEGEEITIMEYLTPFFLEDLNVIDIDNLSIIYPDLNEIFINHYDYTNVPPNYVNWIKTIDRFLANEFQAIVNEKNAFLYQITNGIKDFHLRENKVLYVKSFQQKPSNGLLYPSVNPKRSGVNLVLKKNYYKRVLVPKKAFKYFVETKLDNFDYRMIKTAVSKEISSDGQIYWQEEIGDFQRVC